MGLIQLLVVLVVIGLVWWLVTNVIPLPQPIRVVALVVLTILAIVWLLDWAGLAHMHLLK